MPAGPPAVATPECPACPCPLPQPVSGTGLGTPCCACFPPCVLEAERGFHQYLKMAVDPAAAQQGPERQGRAVVLPDRSPGAWPEQGLCLMVLTKLLPPPALWERGARATQYGSVPTLKGRYWPGFWNGQSPPGKTGGGRRWGGALSAEGRIRSLAQ